MRVHRDGYIQASKLELEVTDDLIRRAQQSYTYLSVGFEAEIEKFFGISIEGCERSRILPMRPDDRKVRILIESSWRRPSGTK